MAIQNFLSGGFYGSIGKLTGRRWKNKRVVQTKFKPKNPRTPAQQRQRSLFTKGSSLAKIAQQVNWNAPQFVNPIRTDWNMRQTVAINGLKNGQTDWEALPLAPDDFKAQHTIGSCALESISADNIMQVVFEGTNLEAGKKYACAIFIQSGDKKDQIIVGSTPEANVDPLQAKFRLPESDGIEGEEVYIKIASIGDETTDTVALSAGIFLQQKGETPYEFNATLQSITYVAPNQLKIAVKIGAEEIESYDPFTNTTIRIYDKVWTKATALKNDTLSTDNATNIDTTLNIVRTTVAKSSATVTFVAQYANIPNIEKYAAKLDISFTANNIKGTNSTEATQELRLTAQTFPEYIQPMCDIADPTKLYIKANANVKLNGTWTMTGTTYAYSERTTAGILIGITNTYSEVENIHDAITSITSQTGTKYTDESLEELLEENIIDYEIEGADIGFYVDGIDIKDWEGELESTLEFTNGKIAFNGYRVYTMPKDQYNTTEVYITFEK